MPTPSSRAHSSRQLLQWVARRIAALRSLIVTSRSTITIAASADDDQCPHPALLQGATSAREEACAVTKTVASISARAPLGRFQSHGFENIGDSERVHCQRTMARMTLSAWRF